MRSESECWEELGRCSWAFAGLQVHSVGSSPDPLTDSETPAPSGLRHPGHRAEFESSSMLSQEELGDWSQGMEGNCFGVGFGYETEQFGFEFEG